MKNHIFRRLFVAALVLTLPSPAQAIRARDPQKGETPAACAGLHSPVKHKNMGRNVPARKKESNWFCGDPQKHVLAGKVGQHLQKIVQASKRCESALKRTVSPSFSIENLVRKPTDRLLKACIQTRAYNAVSERMCDTYGQNAERAKGIGGVAIDEVRGRDAFETIAKMHDPLVTSYKKLAEDAAGEAKEIDQRVPGIADNHDKVLSDEVDFIKKAIKFNYDKAKELGAEKLPQRRQLSGEASGLAEMGTLRFRTQREVKEFYSDLDSCISLHKDNGLLDKWKNDYNKVIAKELSEMRTEAKSLASHFSDISADHQRQAAKMRAEVGEMGGVIASAGTGRQPANAYSKSGRGIMGGHSPGSELPASDAELRSAANTANSFQQTQDHWQGYVSTGRTFSSGNSKYTEWCKRSGRNGATTTCYFRPN